MYQSQKSLRYPKIPVFFVAKLSKIMTLGYLDMAVTSLMYQNIVITSINSFCVCEGLLLGRKGVQFK